MKYEFRKLRTTLVVLLLTMAALELAFLLGDRLDKDNLVVTSVVLLSLLAFGAYVFILVSGVASYSRELKDRTGYLVFMTPNRPIAIVLSKLLTTLLAGLALTAGLALVAWLDYSYLARRLGLDASMVRQINMYMRMLIGDSSFDLKSVSLVIVSGGLSVLTSIMLAMCTAYLAITVSATALQNRKGFLRSLLSVILFFLITWGASWLTNKAVDRVPALFHTGANSPAGMDSRTLLYILCVSLALNLALGGIFAVVSASLLKRKVSL